MAHSEACQVFIEEQIKEGLEEGKTPYSIGKELAVWVERLFEASIPQKTLEKRAERIKKELPTNVGNHPTTENHVEIQEKPEIKRNEDGNKFVEGTAPGPGRPPKHQRVQAQPNYDHELISKEMEESYGRFKSAILNAKRLKWETTSREAVLEMLQILEDIVKIGGVQGSRHIAEEKNLPKRETQSGHVYEATEAMQIATMAICQLERVRRDDPKRKEAFDRVVKWIVERN